jgi:hypothetical protein
MSSPKSPGFLVKIWQIASGSFLHKTIDVTQVENFS